jgi:hypothetical protein
MITDLPKKSMTIFLLFLLQADVVFPALAKEAKSPKIVEVQPKVPVVSPAVPKIAKTVPSPKIVQLEQKVIQSVPKVQPKIQNQRIVPAQPQAQVQPEVAVSTCSQIAAPLFTRHIQGTDLPATEKTKLQEILNNLYLGYFIRQSGAEIFSRSGADEKLIEADWQALKKDGKEYLNNPFCKYTAIKQNPQDIQANKICMDTASLQQQPINMSYCKQNLQNMYEACGAYQMILKSFQEQLDAKNFKNTQSYDAYQVNYITFHLQRAMSRLANTNSITVGNMTCTPKTTSDVRDQGMIVNIQNNSTRSFAIYQSPSSSSSFGFSSSSSGLTRGSINDTAVKQQIGVIKPGLNNLNLYLAALQSPKATPQTLSEHMLEIVPLEQTPNDNTPFSIQIMTSQQLLALLKSINKDPKGLFFMNGRKIAEKYAVAPNALYLVLIKIPKTNPEGTQFPLEQRIQAIGLDQEHPFFLTMQINEDEVEYDLPKDKNVDSDKKATAKKLIVQPSFFSIQSLPGQVGNLTPVILPDFMSEDKDLKAYTLMLQTSYIAATTDFKFFNQKCFANESVCYGLLGYFDKKNQRRVVLNIYPVYLTKKDLFYLKEIMETVIFDTFDNTYFDIPEVYIVQGPNGDMVANSFGNDYLNIKFTLEKLLVNSIEILNFNKDKKFGLSYDLPKRNDFFSKVALSALERDIFVYVQHINDKYVFLFKDKKDSLLESYSFFLRDKIQNIKIDFLENDSKWNGTTVPLNLINLAGPIFSKFKLNYVHKKRVNRNFLFSSEIISFDKIDYQQELYFYKYPLYEMYLDLYNSFEVSNIRRCMLFENGKLPSFLSILPVEDWTIGIYMVINIENNNENKINSEFVKVQFYLHDKVTKLGELKIKLPDLKSDSNINNSFFIHAYNVVGKYFKTQYFLYLNTAVLLKYIPT